MRLNLGWCVEFSCVVLASAQKGSSDLDVADETILKHCWVEACWDRSCVRDCVSANIYSRH